jgi:hypothetical protein
MFLAARERLSSPGFHRPDLPSRAFFLTITHYEAISQKQDNMYERKGGDEKARRLEGRRPVLDLWLQNPII